MPERYGPFTTVYTWYAKWEVAGVMKNILSDLGGEADLQDMSLDSTSAKVHQHAAGAKKGALMEKPTKK
jgi:transposase